MSQMFHPPSHQHPWAPPFERFFNQSTFVKVLPNDLLSKAAIRVADDHRWNEFLPKSKELHLLAGPCEGAG